MHTHIHAHMHTRAHTYTHTFILFSIYQMTQLLSNVTDLLSIIN